MIRRRSRAVFLVVLTGVVLLETWAWRAALHSVSVEIAQRPVPAEKAGAPAASGHER